MPDYPPSKAMAARLGREPNPACVCMTPLAPLFCPYGHPTACHMAMTCEEARCAENGREQG